MKILLIILLLPAICFGQTKLVPVKKNGKYMAPLVFPLTSEVEIDSTNFWRPKPAPAIQRPFEQEFVIPGKIEAEKFDIGGELLSYHDTDQVNQGGKFRQEGVDIESNVITNIAFTVASEWLEYTCNFTVGGIFTISGSTASLNANGKFKVYIDDIDQGTISAPNTGAWTTYKPSSSITSKQQTSGTKVLRIEIVEGNFNLDYIMLSVGTTPQPPTGNVITVRPGTATISTAVRMAASGWTVAPANGTYNEPDFILPAGVSLVGESKDGVIINALTKKVYPADDPLKNGLIQARSDSRINGNQRIANLTIKGNFNAITGIVINNRDNVTVEDIYLENCNFVGIWWFYADNAKMSRVKTFNTSWCSTGFASGEISFAEISNFIFEDIEPTSNSPSRGYGLKFMWGNYQEGGTTKYRNLYSGTFRNVSPKMNHTSNWANNTSYNIGIELHDFVSKGTQVFENCHFENQVSLHSPYADNFQVVFRNCTGDFKNDRYSIEAIKDNILVERCDFKNASQCLFNGQRNRMVNNVRIVDSNFDQGTAPTYDWGGFILVGYSGAQNFVVRNTKIRKKSNNAITRWQQDPKTGVDIDTSNPVTNF